MYCNKVNGDNNKRKHTVLFIRWRRGEVHRQLQFTGTGQQPTCRDPHPLTSQMILKIVEAIVLKILQFCLNKVVIGLSIIMDCNEVVFGTNLLQKCC